jgi:hypothetical protein
VSLLLGINSLAMTLAHGLHRRRILT